MNDVRRLGSLAPVLLLLSACASAPASTPAPAPAQVVERLAREHSKQQALQLALITLDESLSMRTRRAACEELERLLSADEIQDFLEKFRSPPATGP